MTISLKQIITQNLSIIAVCTCLLFSCSGLTEEVPQQDEMQLNLMESLSLVDELKWEDPQAALVKADEIIAQSKGLSNKYFVGKAEYFKAFIYDDIIQDVSKAYFHYNEALKLLNETDSSTMKMRVLNNLGILYRFYGQYEAAFNSYEQALELGPELTVEDLSDVYYNYGVALKVKGETDEDAFYAAEEAFTKALDLAQQIDYHANISDVNNQIGMMYNDIGDFDMAKIAYRNNIRRYQAEEGMEESVARAYHGLGNVFMEEGNIAESVRAFEQALVFRRSSALIFLTKYDLGTALMQGGFNDEAVKIWKEALQEKHNKNNIEQVQVYAKLSEVLASNGNYKEAMDYSLIYNESIKQIVEEEKTYIAKNDKVLFEDIIRDYDEFNAPQPFYADFKIMGLLALLLVPVTLLLVRVYYKSKLVKKVSETVSRIDNEFQHIKVE